MADQNYSDNNKPQLEKAKKSLVYLGILSVIMLFGGLTSAYIVSMGDSFWIKIPAPTPFWISTAVIIISSVFAQLAVYFTKKKNRSAALTSISIAFLLGLSFVYYQFKGYGALVDTGAHFTGSGVVVTDGRYGDYYTVKQDGKLIGVNGNEFLKGDQEMSDADLNSYQEFMSQFLSPSDKETFRVKKDPRHQLYFEGNELQVMNDTLAVNDSTGLNYTERLRLFYLARNVQDKRGDFFLRGKIGKDFHIFYKGKELEYKNRSLYYKGKELDPYLQLKANGSPDTSSSYLWLITALHLAHIAVALLYLLSLVIRSFSGKINSENIIGLRMGVIFWHFLGILWIYLLLFLLFIH